MLRVLHFFSATPDAYGAVCLLLRCTAPLDVSKARTTYCHQCHFERPTGPATVRHVAATRLPGHFTAHITKMEPRWQQDGNKMAVLQRDAVVGRQTQAGTRAGNRQRHTHYRVSPIHQRRLTTQLHMPQTAHYPYISYKQQPADHGTAGPWSASDACAAAPASEQDTTQDRYYVINMPDALFCFESPRWNPHTIIARPLPRTE